MMKRTAKSCLNLPSWILMWIHDGKKVCFLNLQTFLNLNYRRCECTLINVKVKINVK
jgi:hypothetical protein